MSYCQLERRDWRAEGISPDIDWRAVRTMGLETEEAASLREREELMSLTKRESGRRVMEELLLSSAGRRSGWQERVSGVERRQPGTWIILRSKSARSRSHWAW